MTDASPQSPASRWVLVTFTTIVAIAAVWLAAHLDSACLVDSTGGCSADSRQTPAVIAAIAIAVTAVLAIVVTYLAPAEVRSRVFGPLYALLIIVSLAGLAYVVLSSGFSIPPSFTFD